MKQSVALRCVITIGAGLQRCVFHLKARRSIAESRIFIAASWIWGVREPPSEINEEPENQ